jgi:hypothetical protein
MAWLIRTLRIPANESQMSFVLALCAFIMALMSIALIWQAQIIADQKDVIHYLYQRLLAG